MGQGVSLEKSPPERYFLQKVKLGEGSFGTVWRAVDRQTQSVVAVKQLDKAVLPKRGVRRSDIEREVAVMQAVSHPNVTQLFSSWEDSQSIFLALEYCNGGDFGDKVREKGMELEESMAADWMHQIVSAIWVLHCKNICHRDIKPDNFMVHNEVLKLSDFGLAVQLAPNALLTDKCGTPAFMSPEQHQLARGSKGYNHSCDVWAAGITMYMLMFAGKHPFLVNSQQLDERSLLSGHLDFSVGSGFFGFAMPKDRYSETARILCKQMVTPDMSRRITAAQARQSVWFKEHGVGKRPEADPIVPAEGSPALACKPTPTPIARQNSNLTVEGHESKEARGWWPFEDVTKLPAMVPSPAPSPAPAAPAPAPAPASAQELQQLQQQLQQQRQAQGPQPLTDSASERIQELEEQLRLVEQQVRKEAEQHRLQKEQNESQWEIMMQMKRQLQKQQTVELEVTAAKVVEECPAQPSSTRSYSRKTVQLGDKTWPATAPIGKGMRCRYWSQTHGGCWLPARVEKANPDGTFDLDIKQHACIENISPTPDVPEAEAWPPGTSVSYNSTSAQRWIPAVVQSFNDTCGSSHVATYNLDVRPCADCGRIRPRHLKEQGSPVAADAG
mmetsp:Transcript_59285/g.141313  ORF Transcript_59285/g.141313 Transcript_59285/m.141313 type:complete len:613 (+) Transcript_59285:81-1919(+)